jgi:hypothetical protein
MLRGRPRKLLSYLPVAAPRAATPHNHDIGLSATGPATLGQVDGLRQLVEGAPDDHMQQTLFRHKPLSRQARSGS